MLGQPQRLLRRGGGQGWRAPVGVDDEQVGGVRPDVQDGFPHGSRLTASAILCAACGLLTGMTERIVTVDAGGGVELCIDEYGDAGDPVILLIAGAAASMDLWEPELCQQLADAGRHVIRYDHRDTGRSTTSPPGSRRTAARTCSVTRCGCWTRSVRTRPTWSGCRWVEAIAQVVAVERPERVLTLTLMSTGAAGERADTSELPGRRAAYRGDVRRPAPGAGLVRP